MTKDEALEKKAEIARELGLDYEPVAWGMEQPDGEILDVISPEEHARLEGGYTVPLYRQRTWVGLTKEERHEISMANRPYCANIMAAHEEELKRRNT
jgi:hypothetical protein